MRLAFAGLIAMTTVLASACGGVEPGSPDWCKNTPIEKQVEDPPAMEKCLTHAVQPAS